MISVVTNEALHSWKKGFNIMRVNDPRSLLYYLSSSEYGQKNPNLNGYSNHDLCDSGAVR